MESDSIHSAVEHAKKNTKVYHPSHWDTIISMARKRNPYIVIPLNYRDFYDLKELRKNLCDNMKITTASNRLSGLRLSGLKYARTTHTVCSSTTLLKAVLLWRLMCGKVVSEEGKPR